VSIKKNRQAYQQIRPNPLLVSIMKHFRLYFSGSVGRCPFIYLLVHFGTEADRWSKLTPGYEMGLETGLNLSSSVNLMERVN